MRTSTRTHSLLVLILCSATFLSCALQQDSATSGHPRLLLRTQYASLGFDTLSIHVDVNGHSLQQVKLAAKSSTNLDLLIPFNAKVHILAMATLRGVMLQQADTTFTMPELAEVILTLNLRSSAANQSSTQGMSSSSTPTDIPGTVVDMRDGHRYRTVVIGTQEWMAENLDFGQMIPNSSGQTNDQAIEKFCFGNLPSNCDALGGLYQWAEAMALPDSCNVSLCTNAATASIHQGICPTGWHLPSGSEWLSLADYLGGYAVAGGKLKSATSFSASWDALGYANDGNSSGFSALPAGVIAGSLQYRFLDSSAYFWSTAEGNSLGAEGFGLTSVNAGLSYNTAYTKTSAYSVRCINDVAATSSSTVLSSSSTTSSSSSIPPQNTTCAYDAAAKTLTCAEKAYKTVVIGTQTWMAENLNFNPPLGHSWCYENADGYCTAEGRLYDWPTAMSVCPTNWHLPSPVEWDTLAAAVGGMSTAGTALKSISGWYSSAGITNADSYGFTGRPSGVFMPPSTFAVYMSIGEWWTSAPILSSAEYRYLHMSSNAMQYGDYLQSYGLSVRCIMD